MSPAHLNADQGGQLLLAHTASCGGPGEPLFTPAAWCPALADEGCPACANLHAKHGHLNKVAWLAKSFASELSSPDSSLRKVAMAWAYKVGLWHDLGKFSAAFQSYLRAAGEGADPHAADGAAGSPGRVDHSTAGAAFVASLGSRCELAAYIIAGHHCGLADGSGLFHERLAKKIPEWRQAAERAGVPLDQALPPLPPPTGPVTREECSLRFAAFTRMIFSCLVDADRLATEAFMNPEAFSERPRWPADILQRMLDRVETNLAHLKAKSPASLVNRCRAEVASACGTAALLPPGFFQLTVPTGGGKTLASMRFALRHALAHQLRRVIYVAPFTSILDQTAGIFRELFAEVAGPELDVVLEHHSNQAPGRETQRNQQAVENWDAPLVVTTNVQLYESWFASRTSDVRKLHRLARSVIILDEAQSLPATLLAPCLSALKILARDFGATVVLCTATQPAVLKRPDFAIGIPPEAVRTILPDPEKMFARLKRTRIGNLGAMADDELANHVLGPPSPSALIIVNTTRHAADLHSCLQRFGLQTETLLHLSARMCPLHRVNVLDRLKQRLRDRLATVLVATPVVEAGVDISFPRVYRAASGLDALAQAAGRCNRHGELYGEDGTSRLGEVWRFTPADHPLPDALHEIRRAAQIGDELLETYAQDLLDPAAIEAYFRLYYWARQSETHQWDQPGVLGMLNQADPRVKNWARTLQFARAADAFRIIANDTRPVLMPYGEEGLRLRARLCQQEHARPFTWRDYREAQRFSVNVQRRQYAEWVADRTVRELQEGALAVLQDDARYHAERGLGELDIDRLIS